MNRHALLWLVIAVGCSKTPPGPVAPATPTGTAPTPPTWTAPAATPNSSKFELRGHQVGTMSIEEFQKLVPESDFAWMPGDPPGTKTALLKNAGTFADRPLLAVMYTFYDGVLEQISLDPRDPADLPKFREHLEAKYGAPEPVRAGFVEWKDDSTVLMIEPASMNLTSKTIKAKREAAEKAKAK